MRNYINKLAVAIFLTTCTAFPASAVPEATVDNSRSREWNFDVFLGDSKVGYHHFRLVQDLDQQRLVSEADFRVKLLFVTVYKYQHENVETWQGDCLQEIEFRTNANGKKFSVFGLQGPEAFEVQASGLRTEVPGCVKTFAYWNPDFLEESALLNSQTGELLPVSVESIAEEPFTVRGEAVTAIRYRLQARGMDLDLWYSNDREWLGLQSTTKDGRTIRYRLT